MAFIGNSREDPVCGHWELFACLDVEDCRLIKGQVCNMLKRAERSLVYYRDIIEGGEATNAVANKLVEKTDIVERLERISSILEKMINMEGGRHEKK